MSPSALGSNRLCWGGGVGGGTGLGWVPQKQSPMRKMHVAHLGVQVHGRAWGVMRRKDGHPRAMGPILWGKSWELECTGQVVRGPHLAGPSKQPDLDQASASSLQAALLPQLSLQ